MFMEHKYLMGLVNPGYLMFYAGRIPRCLTTLGEASDNLLSYLGLIIRIRTNFSSVSYGTKPTLWFICSMLSWNQVHVLLLVPCWELCLKLLYKEYRWPLGKSIWWYEYTYFFHFYLMYLKIVPFAQPSRSYQIQRYRF